MRKLIPDRSTPLVYLITDRRLLTQQAIGQNLTPLIEFANRAAAAGVDMVQIRERDLPARDTFQIAETLSESSRGAGTQVLVNDRADVAQSAGAGVHLTTRSLTVDVVRAAFGPHLLIGVSTHKPDEVTAAERMGADFVVFGPVFETQSKIEYGSPVGVEALRAVATSVMIPVLALGGITVTNYRDALDAGAAGVAGISMFTEAPDLAGLVAAIKNHRTA